MFICASGCKVTYNAKRAIEAAAAQIILQKQDIPIVFLSSHIELECSADYLRTAICRGAVYGADV